MLESLRGRSTGSMVRDLLLLKISFLKNIVVKKILLLNKLF